MQRWGTLRISLHEERALGAARSTPDGNETPSLSQSPKRSVAMTLRRSRQPCRRTGTSLARPMPAVPGRPDAVWPFATAHDMRDAPELPSLPPHRQHPNVVTTRCAPPQVTVATASACISPAKV
jgi:hypothetical protein